MTYMTEQQLVDRVTNESGYGTLGYLVNIIVNDREEFDPVLYPAVLKVVKEHGDVLWNEIVGPCIDELTKTIKQYVGELMD